MSTKRSVVLVDDVNARRMDDVQSVVYSVGGRTYRLDLSATSRQEFEAALAPWVAVSQRVNRREAKPLSRKLDRQATAKIRQWARDRSIPISDRGRIPDRVRDLYASAVGEVTA